MKCEIDNLQPPNFPHIYIHTLGYIIIYIIETNKIQKTISRKTQWQDITTTSGGYT